MCVYKWWCAYSLWQSGHLARHNRIHTGEKNFPCLFPGCQSRFSRQDNMMQHYRTHMSPKSRKSTKRNSITTMTTSTTTSSSPVMDDSRPRPRLHAHHRIQFGVERPLTIDQHLSNYHQSLASPERFSSVRYENGDSNAIRTSVISSNESITNITSRNGKDSFYQHRQLSFPNNNNTKTQDTASKSHASSPSSTQSTTTHIDHNNNESDRRDADGLLQLAHVVSTFGWIHGFVYSLYSLLVCLSKVLVILLDTQQPPLALPFIIMHSDTLVTHTCWLIFIYACINKQPHCSMNYSNVPFLYSCSITSNNTLHNNSICTWLLTCRNLVLNTLMPYMDAYTLTIHNNNLGDDHSSYNATDSHTCTLAVVVVASCLVDMEKVEEERSSCLALKSVRK